MDVQNQKRWWKWWWARFQSLFCSNLEENPWDCREVKLVHINQNLQSRNSFNFLLRRCKWIREKPIRLLEVVAGTCLTKPAIKKFILLLASKATVNPFSISKIIWLLHQIKPELIEDGKIEILYVTMTKLYEHSIM